MVGSGSMVGGVASHAIDIKHDDSGLSLTYAWIAYTLKLLRLLSSIG